MTQIPQTLEGAIAQAKEATLVALNDGYTKLQVEIALPEIALKAQAIAQQFLPLFEEYGTGLKVMFPDTGASALARRDWGETDFKISDLGSPRTPVEYKVSEDDQIFLVVCPTSVEVEQVEKLCNLAGDRPVILLIPQLENVSIVGIGYAARQLRERFLGTLATAYYLKPLEGLAILRQYPHPWQIWLETEDSFELIAEEPQKPMGDTLELILRRVIGEGDETDTATPVVKSQGIFGSLKQFLKALSS